MRWLTTTYLLGDRVLDWLAAAGIAAFVFLTLLALKRLIAVRLGAVAARVATGLDDLVVGLARRTRPLLVAVPALYLGSLYLSLPGRAAATLRAAAIVAVLLQIAFWSTLAVDYWVSRQRHRLEQDATSAALGAVLRIVVKVAVWSVLLLLALDNLGVNVTALIAGLGIGGVAVALALQNILGDLLASLSIVLDKPFVIGDNITVDEVSGVVESIGVKTTRLRSVNGEQVVLANGDLLKSRLRNWTRMAERRVVLAFGVPYQTPAATVERIPALVRSLVEAQDLTRFERAHFKGFGVSALEFEAVYWVLTPELGAAMDRQQAVNLALLRVFEREGIGFAYTTLMSALSLPPLPPGEEGRGGEGPGAERSARRQ